MQHDAGDGIFAGLAGIAGHLDILKTVEGEARRPFLALLVAAQNVGVRRAGFAEIFRHQPTIRVKHFAVAQLDFCSGRAFDFQANIAGKILAEIENINAIRRRGDGDRIDFFNRPHRQAGKGFEFRWTLKAEVNRTAFDFYRPAVRFGIVIFIKSRRHTAVFHSKNRRLPFGIIKTRRGPAGGFLPRIVSFAHQKIAFANRPVAGDFPRFVGRNDFARAVSVFNFQLRHQRGRSSVGVTPDSFGADTGQQAETDVAGIPAVRDPRAECVAAGLHHESDIVSIVVSALMIIRPARRKARVTDALAVQVKFVDAERGGINCGTLDGIGGGKLLAKLMRGRKE